MAQQAQPNPFSVNGLAGMDMNGQHGQQHGVDVQARNTQQHNGPPTSTPSTMDMGVSR